MASFFFIFDERLVHGTPKSFDLLVVQFDCVRQPLLRHHGAVFELTNRRDAMLMELNAQVPSSHIPGEHLPIDHDTSHARSSTTENFRSPFTVSVCRAR